MRNFLVLPVAFVALMVAYCHMGAMFAQAYEGTGVLFRPATGTDFYDRALIDVPFWTVTGGLTAWTVVGGVVSLRHRWVLGLVLLPAINFLLWFLFIAATCFCGTRSHHDGHPRRTAVGIIATMIRRLPLVFTPQPEGGFTVTSPVLPELVTEGDTLEEAFANVGDALSAVLEIYADEGRPLPPGIELPAHGQVVWTDALVEVA